MKLLDSKLEEAGLTFEELENCQGCEPTEFVLSDTSGFNLCSYHEGWVDGFDAGEQRGLSDH